MKRVLVAIFLVPVAASAVFGALGWVLRRRGSSFPLLVSVLSQWLVAYMLWTLADALVQSYGLLEAPGRVTYTRYGFGLFATVFGFLQYRLARTGALRQASRIFVWSQIGWLLLVLAEHGALG